MTKKANLYIKNAPGPGGDAIEELLNKISVNCIIIYKSPPKYHF